MSSVRPGWLQTRVTQQFGPQSERCNPSGNGVGGSLVGFGPCSEQVSQTSETCPPPCSSCTTTQPELTDEAPRSGGHRRCVLATAQAAAEPVLQLRTLLQHHERSVQAQQAPHRPVCEGSRRRYCSARAPLPQPFSGAWPRCLQQASGRGQPRGSLVLHDTAPAPFVPELGEHTVHPLIH